MTGRGTRGCGEVCERVGVQEVAVGGVEGDYIVRGGEGIEGLREWIQLGRVLGGGGGGWGGRAVDGDDLALSGLGARPGPAGSRVLEEGRDKSAWSDCLHLRTMSGRDESRENLEEGDEGVCR